MKERQHRGEGRSGKRDGKSRPNDKRSFGSSQGKGQRGGSRFSKRSNFGERRGEEGDDRSSQNRGFGRPSGGSGRSFSSKRPNKPFGQRDDRRFEKRDSDRRPSREEGDNRSHSSNRSYNKPFGQRDDRRFDRKDSDRRSSREEGDNRSHSSNRPYNKPFGQRDDRRSDRRDSDRRPPRGDGEGRSYSSNRPYKKPYGQRDDKRFEGRDSKRSGRPFSGGRDSRWKSDDQGGKLSWSRNAEVSKETEADEVRLNRFIASSGICSRREADKLIEQGLISINGEVVTQLGTKVKRGDEVRYGGEKLSFEKFVYLILNKPKDYITTSDDPGGRKKVTDLIGKAIKERIYPVGRLDRQTTGLLMFTNDGELAKKLTHPKHGVKKVYHVVTDKPVTKQHLDELQAGVELEDGSVQFDQIAYVGDGQNKKEIGVELHSGKNRVVRRMFEALGYDVVKLDRVSFAGLTKKKIARGKWRLLTQKEINSLKMIS